MSNQRIDNLSIDEKLDLLTELMQSLSAKEAIELVSIANQWDIEYDNDGQVILYTGTIEEDQATPNPLLKEDGN